VAILDMKMPQMDGLDLAAAIRREPGIAQLPLIMLTSLHSQGEGAAARAWEFAVTWPSRCAA